MAEGIIPKILNSKSEILNKFKITNHKFKTNTNCILFGTFGFIIYDLFRIQNFGFRISLMTIKQTLKLAIAKLSTSKITRNPHYEAEILLSHILKKPREFLLAHGEKKL